MGARAKVNRKEALFSAGATAAAFFVKPGKLFRVASDILQDVGITFDEEIKTPVTGDAGLPTVFAFVVLLGAQGRVAQILEQEQRLLVESLLDFLGRLRIVAVEVRSAADLQRTERLVFLALSFFASL